MNQNNNKILQIEKEIQKNLDISKLGLYKPQYEYKTNVGYIDILAQDKNGFYVVIEIKVGKAGDSAIGQILGYMEAINAKRGIILANDFNKRVKLIAKKLNISLIPYKITTIIDNKEIDQDINQISQNILGKWIINNIIDKWTGSSTDLLNELRLSGNCPYKSAIAIGKELKRIKVDLEKLGYKIGRKNSNTKKYSITYNNSC